MEEKELIMWKFRTEDDLIMKLNERLETQVKEIDNLKIENKNLHEQIERIHQTVIKYNENMEVFAENMSIKLWHMQYSYDVMLSNLAMHERKMDIPNNKEKLRNLKGKYVGKKCCIIGNGPSLKAEDLDLLYDKNITCFACNKINKIFNKTKWKPHFYFCTDIIAYSKKVGEYSQETVENIILPIDFLDYLPEIKENMIFYPFIRRYSITPEFSLDVEKGVYEGGTVLYAIFQFALYMGFSTIYLLGADMDFPMKELKDGKRVVDLVANDMHFYEASEDERGMQNQFESWMDFNNPKKSGIYTMEAPYNMLKYIAGEREVKVYNATRGGKLEVFPRVLLEDIL